MINYEFERLSITRYSQLRVTERFARDPNPQGKRLVGDCRHTDHNEVKINMISR